MKIADFRRFMGGFALPLMLSACVTAPATSPAPDTLPAMRMFQGATTATASRSNRALAQDFLDLTFRLENGEALPVFTRFEGPVTLRMAGTPSEVNQRDLSELLARLRREAGVQISQISGESQANITVEFLPYRTIRRAVPTAVCIVVPGVSSWHEYQRQRPAERTSWLALQRREHVAIFIPQNQAPQDVRDCLHEELAQALGPLNDLWRLNDSVFNDDNFHVVLTRFDMLMLRLTYDPLLRSGMTRDQVAARLPSLLERINPEGSFEAGRGNTDIAPADWNQAIETALYSSASASRRLQAAQTAISIAQARNLSPQLKAFSHYAQGRLLAGRDHAGSTRALLAAGEIYASLPGSDLQAAHVAQRLAFAALKSGNAQDVIDLIDGALPVVEKAQNAILLSSMLMLKARAQDMLGQADSGRATRQNAIAWGLYGYGSMDRIERQLREIDDLAPDVVTSGES